NVRKSEGTALDSALRAGTAMVSVIERKLIRHSQREDYYRETCGHERTGRLYVFLAKNRDVIDANRNRDSDLNIAKAVALIRAAKGVKRRRKSSSGTKTSPAPAPRTLDGWTDAEIASALFRLGFDRFQRAVPNPFRPLLVAQAGRQILRAERGAASERQVKHLDLKVVGGTDTEAPPTPH